MNPQFRKVNDAWHILTDEVLPDGATVNVTRKDGTSTTETVDRYIGKNQNRHLHAIESEVKKQNKRLFWNSLYQNMMALK